MKRVSIVSATIVSLLFGATAIVLAQHDEHGNDQNRSNQGQQHQQAQPPQQHQQAATPTATSAGATPTTTSAGATPTANHQRRPRDRRKVRQNRNRLMAAPITAACNPTALRTVASTPAAFRNTKDRCAMDLVSLAPVRGKTSINPGPSAEAITATGFPTTASGNTSAAITSSGSTVFLWSSWAECLASSTTDTGSRSWIRGRNHGGRTGTKPTMCILTTPAMGTICMTVCTLIFPLPSRLRFS